HAAKLAIELDGGQHHSEEGRTKDERRARFLARQGIKVLRFWNHEVFEDTEPMLEAIVRALGEGREGDLPTLTRPRRGRPLPVGEVKTTTTPKPGDRPLAEGEAKTSPIPPAHGESL